MARPFAALSLCRGARPSIDSAEGSELRLPGLTYGIFLTDCVSREFFTATEPLSRASSFEIGQIVRSWIVRPISWAKEPFGEFSTLL